MVAINSLDILLLCYRWYTTGAVSPQHTDTRITKGIKKKKIFPWIFLHYIFHRFLFKGVFLSLEIQPFQSKPHIQLIEHPGPWRQFSFTLQWFFKNKLEFPSLYLWEMSLTRHDWQNKIINKTLCIMICTEGVWESNRRKDSGIQNTTLRNINSYK